MRIITNLTAGLDIFSALNSKVRINIIKLLNSKHKLSFSDLAKNLDISISTLTPHIKKLEKAGIIEVKLSMDEKYPAKVCTLIENKIIIEIIPEHPEYKSFEFDIDVGKYFDYNVTPTCGLASAKKLIGSLDDPRYFSHPERFDAGIIWFTQGYVEYRIPNLLTINEKPEEVQITCELCSEAPGVISHFPSDIYFIVNGINLGYWTSPGELFDRKGRYTPDWWFQNFPQYGRIKVITVNHTGTYLDGLLLSPVTVSDLNMSKCSDISVKIEIPENAKNIGGITLFGKGFGDYDVGIKVKVLYKNGEKEKADL
ncbi:MAG: helix-turn-helix domain-containing protein [Bacilli bacterium]|nr:helix-turn-helix domain-containing protein [Bacilli bacterium]MDD4076922.1 helix-turn-helix domain-containing protein [Bacilli bacterium]